MKAIVAALWLLASPPVESGEGQPSSAAHDGDAPSTVVPDAPKFDEVVSLATPPVDPAPSEPPPDDPPAVQPAAPPAPVPTSAPRKDWRRWGSPLLSLFVPGLGQIANAGIERRPNIIKGITLLYGTTLSVVGASILYRASNDGSRPLGREYARLIGYGTLSTLAPMLWIYAIADAYRIAARETIDPHARHKLRMSVARSMTVGFRADPDRPGFYDDWSVALIGQPVPRLGVGVSDLGLKLGRDSLRVVQFGVRVGYRVVEQQRLWLDISVGAQMQVASIIKPQPLAVEPGRASRETRFGATPYAQLDLRVFVLDRLSLDLTPRVSVPVTTRYFTAGSLPRFATTLELGAGASVYF